MIDWDKKIQAWRSITAFKVFSPARESLLASARERVKELPTELERFYQTTNGLSAGPFKVLPLEDQNDIKRTWDSLQRANDPHTTRFLGRSVQLLKRFIVFADIGAGRAGACDREDGSIWYEEAGNLQQTDLSLDEFVEANLRDIAEL